MAIEDDALEYARDCIWTGIRFDKAVELLREAFKDQYQEEIRFLEHK